MEAIAIIQANHTDLLGDDRDPAHYCIEALRKSRHIERIVIAAPDLPENGALRKAAESWGVDCHLGSEFDVTRRIIDAAESAGAVDGTVLARVLLNRFFLDIDLVDRMIELLATTRSDFVTLPYDFNINFGADVMTLECLRRADGALATTDMSMRFRPWLFIEEHPELFRVSCLEDVPTYPGEMLEQIRGGDLSRERDCGRCADFSYEFAAQFVGPTDTVLDPRVRSRRRDGAPCRTRGRGPWRRLRRGDGARRTGSSRPREPAFRCRGRARARLRGRDVRRRRLLERHGARRR